MNDLPCHTDVFENRHGENTNEIFCPPTKQIRKHLDKDRVHTDNHHEPGPIFVLSDINYPVEQGKCQKTPAAAFDDEWTGTNPFDNWCNRIKHKAEHNTCDTAGY